MDLNIWVEQFISVIQPIKKEDKKEDNKEEELNFQKELLPVSLEIYHIHVNLKTLKNSSLIVENVLVLELLNLKKMEEVEVSVILILLTTKLHKKL